MDKDKSLQLKGVAILMMLFLHLFNTQERVAECTTYVNFLNGKPLVYALARVCGLCVPIYLFISGYGLAKSHSLGTGALLRRLRRVFTRYWLVFIVFIPWGCIVAPKHYPDSAWAYVLNFLSLSDSYNGEWWFLFPYVLLLFLARWLIPFVRWCQRWQNGLVFAILFALSVVATNVKNAVGDNLLLMRMFHLLLVLPAFYAGVCVACREEVARGFVRGWRWPLLWMLLLLFVRGFIGASVVNVLFCVPFVMLFVGMQMPRRVQALLSFFGRYSMFMWLTHTFYAYYFFHDLLYGLRYPLVMYVVLVVASLVTAMGLDGACRMIEKQMNRP